MKQHLKIVGILLGFVGLVVLLGKVTSVIFDLDFKWGIYFGFFETCVLVLVSLLYWILFESFGE